MIIDRIVTIERKERVPYNAPGNRSAVDMSNANRDKARITVAYHEADETANVTPLQMTILVFADEARGVDVGDKFRMHIDFTEVVDDNALRDIAEDASAPNAESVEGRSE